ncbi:Uncharacterized protein PECH_005897 [Penicillium ucsense]|uniref:Translation initiation factor 5A-like N-terminal domain-containing protein n=1 Tax=Penicillium ucsense TaxID=2839758 RepID=A0A8J8WLW3_9EURO|nr:Uncharacterized protein PECM_000690 [Penicillium ucsense]KAF7736079.1 Uncharacterized protein PECH_005897 [Penicillium ucsense]
MVSPGPRRARSFERHSRRDAPKSVNLDFDARVPIPFSVFPSSYRSDAVSETTQTRVEGEVQLDRTSHVEREDTRVAASLPDPRVHGKEEVDIHIHQREQQPPHHHQHPHSAPQIPHEESPRYESTAHYESHQPRNYAAEVELTRERYPNYRESSVRFEERPQVYDQVVENQLDVTEREYRRRTSPTYEVDVSYDRRYQDPSTASQYQPSYPVDVSYDRSYQPQPASAYRGSEYSRRETVKVEKTTVRQVTPASRANSKMGYYDDEGQYHSFRRGVERAADRVLHPFHHHDREEVVSTESGPARFSEGVREDVRIVEPRNRAVPGETVPIPCHFVRVGDILILQGRPCQVIRITVSPQTGQHRYLGVDLFTRQLHEESSFVSNPSPSVVVQTMLGPVYKTYRILDLRDDGKLVAMTETGDVKQGLPVVSQGQVFKRIRDAFADGRGSVRALVINDGGRELVVDFKVIHGSRL